MNSGALVWLSDSDDVRLVDHRVQKRGASGAVRVVATPTVSRLAGQPEGVVVENP
jgi:hypothetical protein